MLYPKENIILTLSILEYCFYGLYCKHNNINIYFINIQIKVKIIIWKTRLMIKILYCITTTTTIKTNCNPYNNNKIIFTI